jgi:hypothetical protein
MLYCHSVTIGTVGDHNLSSTITSNIYAVSLVVMTYLLEQRNGWGLSAGKNSTDGIFRSIQMEKLLLRCPCDNVRAVASMMEFPILL